MYDLQAFDINKIERTWIFRGRRDVMKICINAYEEIYQITYFHISLNIAVNSIIIYCTMCLLVIAKICWIISIKVINKQEVKMLLLVKLKITMFNHKSYSCYYLYVEIISYLSSLIKCARKRHVVTWNISVYLST